MIAQPIWNAGSASSAMPVSVLIRVCRPKTIHGGQAGCPADGELQRSLNLLDEQEWQGKQICKSTEAKRAGVEGAQYWEVELRRWPCPRHLSRECGVPAHDPERPAYEPAAGDWLWTRRSRYPGPGSRSGRAG